MRVRRLGLRRAVAAAAGVAAVLLVGACTAGQSETSSQASASAPARTTGGGLQSRFERTVNSVLPSVVRIQHGHALGSGIVFDNKGHVVTNAHVVGDAKRFSVRLATDGKTYQANLVGVFRPSDLAVIRLVQPPELQPAQFANSSKLEVGQIVLAMGNPLGLQGSVTNGIVSALGRTVNEPQGSHSPGAVIPNAVQTSAAINPGNSGGALVDLNAKVVGIPTLAAVIPELGGQAAGIGFAIPSNTVTDIAKQLIEHGHVVNSHRAALGISARTVVGPNGRPQGVGIVHVTSGGPADKAGLRAGGIILRVASTPTPSVQSLQDVLAQHQPGDTVKVQVAKPGGGKETATVTLGELPGKHP